MKKELTAKQKQILEFLKEFLSEHGYPPTVREIGKHVNLKSTSSVHNQLNNLEKKGYIKRGESKQRAIEIVGFSKNFASEEKEVEEEFTEVADTVEVPILGSVAAGYPLFAEENVETSYPIPSEWTGGGDCFLLHVNGDSMMGDGILDGDLVLCRKQTEAMNGDIVVALVENETTVKTLYREKDRFRLQPSNDDYEPIYTRELTIQGKVIAVMRIF